MASIKHVLINILLLSSMSLAAVSHTPVQYEADIRSAFRQGDWESGKTILNDIDREYGTLSVFCELNGAYYYHYKQYDEARRYLLLALRDDESNTQALEMLVRVEQETGHYSTAISHVNKLLEYSPYNARLWRTMIELYRLDGNEREADRLLERLYTIYPEDSTLQRDMLYKEQMHYYELHRAGNTQGEEEALRRILAMDPHNKEANRALDALIRRRYNAIFARDKRNEAAERHYEDSLNVIRTANLSATKVMEAIYQKEREEREYVDPEVLAARAHRDSVEAAERARLRYMGDAVDSSYVYLKRHEPERVVPLMDSVLVLDPKHNEAHLLLSLAYERMHEYDSAYYHQAKYHPLPEEVFANRRHLHALAFRAHHNDINLEYQYARRSSVDALTHNAYLDYSHAWTRDVLTGHVGYAGRESYAEEGDSLTYSGGTGVMLGAEYAHRFDSLPVPLTLTLKGSWASKFFPRWTASVALEEELPKEWTLTERLGWRRILDQDDRRENYHLLSLDLSASKAIGHFILIPTFNTYLMLTPSSAATSSSSAASSSAATSIFFNGSLKMQYFPIDGDRSCVFASAGVGNAPESALLNSSMPFQFDRLNTFVSGGVYWIFTDNLGATFSTSWYTQEQRGVSVRNYLYINASLQISF